ncbi:hypothetical protein MBLNU230_g3756t1 [Neophaeotheca triangularis]
MLSKASLALGCALLASPIRAIPAFESPAQIPLDGHGQEPSDGSLHHDTTTTTHTTTKKRPLTGRFLHMTDFHPDPFYKVYSSPEQDTICHRGHGSAGIYGAETSECDSPFDLVNQTLSWIDRELKDKIDFIVWTGDSARHDNDENNPRNVKQVTELNTYMVESLHKIFGNNHNDDDDDDQNPNNDFIIPIVPNLGNNDVLPHNIMVQGPNKWTKIYSKLWRQFIPEAQKHSFEQGGWFYVEVIPNKLAVFSLNTLYFFDSNSGVDGCAAHSEPGYQQMEWLRIQLQFLRDRGMKAILSGHVPPARTEAKRQWDETCWQKYALWLRQYRDVVVTSLYGHMNYDHFFLQDFEQIRKDTSQGEMVIEGADWWKEEEGDGEDEMHAMLSSNYFTDLRSQWSKIPKEPKSRDHSDAESQAALLRDISDEERPDWEIEQLVSTTKKDKNKKKKKNGKKNKQKKYLDKIGGEFAERYAASFVNPSVVPNLFPTLRVYEYNNTGLSDHSLDADTPEAPIAAQALPPQKDQQHATNNNDLTPTKKKNKKKKPHNPPTSHKSKFNVPLPPPKTSPPGPAYSPQPLSLLKYTQYFANLTRINNDTTATLNHEQQEPSPEAFEFEVLYDSREDDVYQLRDLTIPNVVELARRVGRFREPAGASATENHDDDDDDDDDDDAVDAEKKKHKKKKHRGGKGKGDKHDYSARNLPWYTFVQRAFVGTLGPGEVREEFGR